MLTSPVTTAPTPTVSSQTGSTNTVLWKSTSVHDSEMGGAAATGISSTFANCLPFRNHQTVKFSTCEGHLIGHPVNGQHGLSPIITGLNEKLLWGCVPERGQREHLDLLQ